MSESISFRKGVGLFVMIFIVPAILLQPFRPMLQDLVGGYTLWQSVGMFIGAILATGLTIHSYNLRQRLDQ